jgi:RNA polymerase sigma factor (TIGR02999 family)
MATVTEILNAIEEGQSGASDKLLPAVYDELRRLAAARLAKEPPGQTLDATGLVHEAYVRLVERPLSTGLGGELQSSGGPQWQSRGHFFAAAAEAMRRILVDNARRKGAIKRGGDRAREAIVSDQIKAPTASDDILAVDEALQRLFLVDRQAAELVNLRFFAGLSNTDIADTLGMSLRSVDRLWAYARSWIHRELAGSQAEAL